MGEERLPAAFWKIHEGNPREGPGCRFATLRALGSAGPLPPRPRVLDFGSGPGRHRERVLRLVAINEKSVPGAGRFRF